ncbi:MAG: hypothetical protein JNL80_05310 [Phycisphaerae bacterium]|nr:hypothetical protein [Phycisphaerae bacterium]
MGYPRHQTVARDRSGVYHCVSRCVRRERLLGEGDRIGLIERRLAFLASVFAVDVVEVMPMENHLHLVLVLRTHPELAWCWTAEEVAERWLRLSRSPRSVAPDEPPAPEVVRKLAADDAAVDRLRIRRACLSEFHTHWKEWSAKRFKREGRVTGHFWEGRFGARIVLDDSAAGLTATSANVWRRHLHSEGQARKASLGTTATDID